MHILFLSCERERERATGCGDAEGALAVCTCMKGAPNFQIVIRQGRGDARAVQGICAPRRATGNVSSVAWAAPVLAAGRCGQRCRQRDGKYFRKNCEQETNAGASCVKTTTKPNFTPEIIAVKE